MEECSEVAAINSQVLLMVEWMTFCCLIGPSNGDYDNYYYLGWNWSLWEENTYLVLGSRFPFSFLLLLIVLSRKEISRGDSFVFFISFYAFLIVISEAINFRNMKKCYSLPPTFLVCVSFYLQSIHWEFIFLSLLDNNISISFRMCPVAVPLNFIISLWSTAFPSLISLCSSCLDYSGSTLTRLNSLSWIYSKKCFMFWFQS